MIQRSRGATLPSNSAMSSAENALLPTAMRRCRKKNFAMRCRRAMARASKAGVHNRLRALPRENIFVRRFTPPDTADFMFDAVHADIACHPTHHIADVERTNAIWRRRDMLFQILTARAMRQRVRDAIYQRDKD